MQLFDKVLNLLVLIPKLNKIKGNDNKNLPPKANNNAKIAENMKIKNLTNLDNFFEETFAINFKIK